MLSLPKPFGWPNGTGISIQTDKPINGDVVAGVALSFGCPPSTLKRVAACINQSGRYDCRVTLSKEALHNLKACLGAISARVVILDETTRFRDFDISDFR